MIKLNTNWVRPNYTILGILYVFSPTNGIYTYGYYNLLLSTYKNSNRLTNRSIINLYEIRNLVHQQIRNCYYNSIVSKDEFTKGL